jgi:hypothetical protein
MAALVLALMSAIIKTLPVRFARGQIERFFGLDGKPCWTTYYFTLGRGRPKQSDPDKLYFTHKGIIIGFFNVVEIVQNVGQLPKLTNMDGDPSAWQIKPDAWVAVCRPPFFLLEKKIYHEGFQGWRYFNFVAYSRTIASKLRI